MYIYIQSVTIQLLTTMFTTMQIHILTNFIIMAALPVAVVMVVVICLPVQYHCSLFVILLQLTAMVEMLYPVGYFFVKFRPPVNWLYHWTHDKEMLGFESQEIWWGLNN